MATNVSESIQITGSMTLAYEEILTPEAIAFVAKLTREFRGRRNELLEMRKARQEKLDAGEMPTFLAETQEIRDGDWTVAPLPDDLLDRRVEITGPTDRKMVINALNSGASVFMADFEDANSPTWDNMVEGQINMRDAINRSITFTREDGKFYELNENPAVLMVRPRGWHLDEAHMLVDGEAVPGGIFDFALYFFHSAKEASERGTGTYFYLPKLESHLEARLWNDIFNMAQDELDIERGTIKATVLLETISAAFEMNEILWELRDHSAGLNCGRWDYIFSFIKKFRKHPNFVMPDRGQVGMTTHFMRSYSLLVIKTCHRRGVHAMGGMAAQIPIKGDEEANDKAFAKVRADKEREAKDGHDGTWVAHPGLVPVAKDVFNGHMPEANQIASKPREDVNVTEEDLIAVPEGTITEQGLRQNLKVGIQYVESWLRGNGCVPLYNLMEDAATAEISRTQVWQWMTHGATLDDGRKITPALYNEMLEEEMDAIKAEIGAETFDGGRFPEAVKLFDQMIRDEDFVEFLTLPAYELIK
ncbi:MAG: malate synthase A [Chloroflexota bacterium]